MKMVPSTRKIKNSGGTITKVTCWASRDRILNPVTCPTIQLSTAQEKANRIPTAMVRTTKSAPRYGWSRIAK